jgi:hypothetical protein
MGLEGRMVCRWRHNKSALAAPQILSGMRGQRPEFTIIPLVAIRRWTWGRRLLLSNRLCIKRGHDGDSCGIYTCFER